MSPAAVLVGPPGAGKSTVGRLLAARLGVEFADTDVLLEARAEQAIPDIFFTDGEPALRALEATVVAEALAEHPGVLALGGGAVLAEATRASLAHHPVVLLTVGLTTGLRRTGPSDSRPLLAGDDLLATFSALLTKRMPVYRSIATYEVHTDPLDPNTVADVVARTMISDLDEAPPPT